MRKKYFGCYKIFLLKNFFSCVNEIIINSFLMKGKIRCTFIYEEI